MDREEIEYWGKVLRVAALCHDTGHLPFSHAAEHELLPSGWTHERITRALIYEGPPADGILMMSPPVTLQDVAKVALSPDNLSPEEAESLTDWKQLFPRFSPDPCSELIEWTISSAIPTIPGSSTDDSINTA